MCEDVGPYQHHDIQILDFAHHVWGLDRKIGQQILDMKIELDVRKLYAYRRSESERDLHALFIEFAKLLHSEVTSRFDRPAETFTEFILVDNENGGNIMMSWKAQQPSNDINPNPRIAKHIIEFKHDRYKDTGSFLSQSHKTRLMQTFRTGSKRRTKAQIVSSRAANPERKASPEPASSEPCLKASEASIKKRRRGSASSSVTHPPTKRGRIDKAQLLAHAIECLAATSRRWVTGLLIDTCEVTACYFDRHMVACSCSFRFDRNPAMLALILYAMNMCSKDHAGLDPHHLTSPFDPLHAAATQSNADLPMSHMIGSFFDLAFTANGDGTVEGCGSPGGCPVNDDAQEASHHPQKYVDESQQSQQMDAGGRNEQKDVEISQHRHTRESSCFRVVDLIQRPDDLVSRGTTVYKVQRRLPSGEFSDEVYALKFSWAVKSRLSEIDAIEHLRTTLPTSSHDHLPDLIFADSWTVQQLGLPWLSLKLTLNEHNHQERVLRAFASKYYKKLWEAGSIENFKQAWLDCVEGQLSVSFVLKCKYSPSPTVCHLAFRLGKVLHRDLSENNVMVLPLPDGKAKGVLNDWDMAKLVQDRTNEVLASAYGTGTPPFMATDLLQAEWMKTSQDKLPPHWFRHDLESLFYILVWAAIHYDINLGTRDSEDHPFLTTWTEGDARNHEAKVAFLTGGVVQEKRLLGAIKPEFEQVAKEWIIPLRKLFKKAIFLGTEAEKEDDYDTSTYGGELTFKTFMQAINVTPRTWGIPNFLDESN